MAARRHRLLPLGVIGVAVFIAGMAVAMLRLPEWRNRSVPAAPFFARRLHEVARRAGLALESDPNARLSSTAWVHGMETVSERETGYSVLGPSAAEWLAREGRGPYVVASARTRWTAKDGGELHVMFSTHGLPISAMWMPDQILQTSSSPNDVRREKLTQLFVDPGTRLAETEMSIAGETLHLAQIPNASPPETLISSSVAHTQPYAQRVAGTVAWWRNRMEKITLGDIVLSTLPTALTQALFYLGTFALFLLLLARRRIELQKGLALAVISIALSIAEPIRSSGTSLQMIDQLVKVLAKGIGLFVLWSAAESWLRSTVPNFRTSLDALRAGRLGPNGGRALLAGASIGAAAAGVWIAMLALMTMINDVAPSEGSVRLPMFSARTSPIDEGALRTAVMLLAICAAMRLPVIRRIRGSATVIGALVLATRVPLNSFLASCAVALAVSAILIYAYSRFGLTALLAASVTSTVLPAALFALLHVAWLPTSAALLTAVAAAPVVFGFIGVRRDDAVEEGPYALPAFVRRLEEENRVKYEMELLAKMQLGLLPQETPRVDGYEIAARSILANEAGGDLYDFVHDSAGRLWIAAGDVSGHGYSCAIAQAMTKAGLLSLVEAERTPATVLERLDRVLRGIGAPRTFTSLALLRLDPASGDVLVCNAGHPYPWHASNSSVREVEMPSLPLGQGPLRTYCDETMSMNPGTVIVLSSDGLFEGADAAGRAYGFDRIRDILGKVCRRPADAILTAILDDWRAHIGSAAPADDTTIVVVKRTA